MKDKLSALLDGDLDEQSMRPVFDAIRRERSLRTDWEAYCIIGDVLRGDREGGSDLVARVMADIDAEPTVLAPAAIPRSTERARAWRSMMPLAASLMGVAAVGWVAHTLYAEPEEAMQIAGKADRVQALDATPAMTTSAAIRAVVPNGQDERYREYVFAHQGMTGGGPIPGVVQYLRTVSDARQDSGR